MGLNLLGVDLLVLLEGVLLELLIDLCHVDLLVKMNCTACVLIRPSLHYSTKILQYL